MFPHRNIHKCIRHIMMERLAMKWPYFDG
jgi:hypothetical protein